MTTALPTTTATDPTVTTPTLTTPQPTPQPTTLSLFPPQFLRGSLISEDFSLERVIKYTVAHVLQFASSSQDDHKVQYYLHIEQYPGQLRTLFQQDPMSMTLSGIPTVLGGTWTFEANVAHVYQRDEQLRQHWYPHCDDPALLVTTTASVRNTTGTDLNEEDSKLPARPQVHGWQTPSPSEPSHDPADEDSSMDLSMLPELRARARREVEQAIHSTIPLPDKQAYLEATKKAPELIDKESDPLQFVRYCDYNVWEAAKRLCRYWQERLDVFGPDRAYLPLILSGQGALDAREVKSLVAGFPAILPDTKTGQKAVLFDRRQQLPAVSGETHLKCIFYIFSLLAEDPHAQAEGVLGFVFFVTPRTKKIPFSVLKRACAIASHAFPVKVNWHLLSWLPKSSNDHSVVQELISKGASMFTEHFTAGKVEVHIERYAGQLLSELQELGLTKGGIPFDIGGEWSFDAFAKWCIKFDVERRKSYEPFLARIASGNSTNTSSSERGSPTETLRTATAAARSHTMDTSEHPVATASTVTDTTVAMSDTNATSTHAAAAATVPDPSGTAHDDDATTPPPPPETVEESRKAKRRLLNLIHSRRKRERRRQEFQTLQSEVSKLMMEEHNLKAEQEQLQQWLQQAHELVEDTMEG